MIRQCLLGLLLVLPLSVCVEPLRQVGLGTWHARRHYGLTQRRRGA